MAGITTIVALNAGGQLGSTVVSGTQAALELVLAGVRRDGPEIQALILVAELGPATDLAATEQGALDLITGLPAPGVYATTAAQDLLRTASEEEIRFEDFGVYRGSDGIRAERIYAIIHPEFPFPVRPTIAKRGNCPRLKRSFRGRGAEIAKLTDLLAERPLVTLTGPPGIGKSALALRVAISLGEQFPDGIWWFALDDCASADALAARLASEPELVGLTGASFDTVAMRLAPKDALLILDGCDLLAPEVASFCHQVRSAGGVGLSVLVISRSGLDLEGNVALHLGPLSTQYSGSEANELALIEADALALLYDRADEAGGPLPLDGETVSAALSICQEVDGVPLAVELMALALRSSSPDELLRRLRSQDHAASVTETALGQLSAAVRSAEATLSVAQRSLLEHLAHFEGAWTIGSAAAVAADDPANIAEFYKLHESLLNGSWISYDRTAAAFRLLKPVRAALMTTAVSHQEEFVQRLVTVLKLWSDCVYSPDGAEMEAHLERHYADFFGALTWTGDRPEQSPLAAKYLQCLIPYWSRRSLLSDAHRACTKLLPSLSGIDRLRALMMLGIVTWRRRQLDEAERWYRTAAAESADAKYPVGQGAALSNLGMALSQGDRHEDALAAHKEALALFRNEADTRKFANAFCNAAQAALAAAESAEGEGVNEFLDLARGWLQEFQDSGIGDPALIQAYHHNLGRLAAIQGDSELARLHYRKAISICHEHNLKHEAFEALLSLARIHCSNHQYQQAAQHLGLARAILDRAGHAPTEREIEEIGSLTRNLRNELGQARCSNLMEYGARLELQEV